MQWDTIIGVIIGGFLGGGAQVLSSYYHRFNDTKSLAGSIGGEIDAICRLVEQRNFISEYERKIQEIRAQPNQPIQISDVFVVTAKQNYFQVFESNSARIGLLGMWSRDVAYFYNLAKGLLDTNAQLKPLHEVLFKGGQLSGTRDWLVNVYSGLIKDLKELLELRGTLVPELMRSSNERFIRYLFRGLV